MVELRKGRFRWLLAIAAAFFCIMIIGMGVFLTAQLSFIPSEWIIENRTFIALACMPVLVFIIFASPNPQTENARLQWNKSTAKSLFAIAVCFFVIRHSVSYAMPWGYTKVFGQDEIRTLEMYGLRGSKSRKFCQRIQLANVTDSIVCAQNMFPNKYPRNNQFVTFSGKSSSFGFLVNEARIAPNDTTIEKVEQFELGIPRTEYLSKENLLNDQNICTETKSELGLIRPDCRY